MQPPPYELLEMHPTKEEGEGKGATMDDSD
jgi:hypothetical protein